MNPACFSFGFLKDYLAFISLIRISETVSRRYSCSKIQRNLLFSFVVCSLNRTFAPMKQVRPKKNLGQHFLTDLSIAKRIADTVDEPYAELPVLEVGPGMGVMTQFLIEKPRPLKVVEIDRESVAYLKQTLFRDDDNRTPHIIEGDFLRMDLQRCLADSPSC